MDGLRYAEVAVDAPVSHSRTFSYSIPSRFDVEPGQLVWVPFGRRVVQGVVMELAEAPQVEVTRDILQPIEPSPLVEPVHLGLARWLSRYYFCSLFTAVALFLPPGFEAQVRSRILSGAREAEDLPSLRPQIVDALQALDAKKGIGEPEFLKLLGRNADRELDRLLQRERVRRLAQLPRPRLAPRYESYLLALEREDRVEREDRESSWQQEAEGLPQRQRDLLLAVREQATAYRTPLANKEFGNAAAEALVRKGLLGREWVRVEPSSLGPSGPIEQSPEFTLTPEQAGSLAGITEVLDDLEKTPRVFLLHGVTGSGKTEVYLRAIQRVVARGQQAIFLVPEISLTPQTMQRVNARFPGRVAVLHSRLSRRQQSDQWWKIKDGRCDVVVGPRSSLFAPLPRLGLIVIDEEHEWTYKQEEAHPLYHARTVALELARRTGAAVVLGSATPDVETFYRARRGHYRYLELPYRIGRSNGRASGLAKVEVCDMRRELREGNRSIFSRVLAQGLKDCVDRGQQAILFLNRRGASSIVQCRDCGDVATCSRCSVSLTYHSSVTTGGSATAAGSVGGLLCHRCNRKVRVPSRCSACKGTRIRGLGTGTQKVVEEVEKLLPGVRVERWDADATRSGLNPDDTMKRLSDGDIQVLVGTQLVAKGLDVPNVTLVGVVLADVGLYLPDFRSGERAFSLLCQVAGRAGRGEVPGNVIVQTYTPEHYAIVAAAMQDYGAMFQREIQFRHQMGNPPFNQLVHMVYQDVNDTACQRQAVANARELRKRAYDQGLTDVEVIGPAPGMPHRLRGRYRWHVLLRGRDLHRFLESSIGSSAFPRGCTVDFDPVHVL